MINQLILPSTKSVTDLLTGLRNEQIYIDNTFQRKLVWTNKDRVLLIDSVLSGYPMPEIYLWLQPSNAETGTQRQSVVDGQQRLDTLLRFASNEFSISKTYVKDIENSSKWSGMKWSDLSNELKQQFWEYSIAVRIIPANVSREQITLIFSRLNATDKSLNPQELRNAKFNGKFLKTAEKISTSDNFLKLRIFKTQDIHRMKDVEFCSGLLMYMRNGITEQSQRSVNDTYDIYNDTYPEAESDLQYINSFFERCNSIYTKSLLTASYLQKSVHMYSFFCCEHFLRKSGIESGQIAEKIDLFFDDYNSGSKDDLIENYRTAASSRTLSKGSRSTRVQSLIRYITAPLAPAPRNDKV